MPASLVARRTTGAGLGATVCRQSCHWKLKSKLTPGNLIKLYKAIKIEGQGEPRTIIDNVQPVTESEHLVLNKAEDKPRSLILLRLETKKSAPQTLILSRLGRQRVDRHAHLFHCDLREKEQIAPRARPAGNLQFK